MIRRRALGLAAVCLLLLGAADAPASACALVGAGKTQIDGEEVLIVWDAARHTEHFVRHLQFADAAADFGFLVPTPTRPQLGDVDDGVFESLFALYREPMPRSIPQSDGSAPRGVMAARVAAPVTVVERRRVAGLDATVLAANDAAALNAWLGAHHYPSTPAMTEYLQPYVQRGFFVTAFRYNPGARNERLGTRAVRMSFTTDRPFFPYAEPAGGKHAPGRVFRVSVVSGERMSGLVGTAPWRARTAFADRPAGLAMALGRAVPADAVPRNAWLTTFQEDTSRRGRDDLFFERAAHQARVAGTLRDRVGAGPLDLLGL